MVEAYSFVEIPDSFYCPLTFQIMVDPVIDPDGHSYERSAIEEWLSRSPFSPMTRKSLQIADLRTPPIRFGPLNDSN